MAIRSLLDTLARDVSPFHQERLRYIDEIDLSHIREVIANNPIVGNLETKSVVFDDDSIMAFKQHYAVGVFDPYNLHAVADIVDLFSSAHESDEAAFRQFCETCFGGFFIHGCTLNNGPGKAEIMCGISAYTRKCYRKFFRYVNWKVLRLNLKPANITHECMPWLACSYIEDLRDEELFRHALMPPKPCFLTAKKPATDSQVSEEKLP